ncbi:MAG TPA: YceI family protein [Burkholderiales bacterium]
MGARSATALFLSLALAACAPALVPSKPAVPPGAAALPAGFPAAEYERAAARGQPVYRIDPERSLVVVRVYRAGPLARFGHDHVVASRSIRGYALFATQGSRADLYAPLAALTVDEPTLRAEAGMSTTPSAADIEATRQNMLEKVLEVERFPFVTIDIEASGGGADGLRAEITLHGVSRTVPLSAEIARPDGEHALRARGRFSLRQTDFGMKPFSVLGGGLRVRDEVDVAFDVYGERIGPASGADSPAAPGRH